MDADRGLAAATAVVIVAVVLASGPLVGAVDLTLTRATNTTANAPLGSGTANVSIISTPETGSLDRGAFGADAYTLQAPNTTVAVNDAAGRPFLNYKLHSEALGYSTSTLYTLGDRAAEQLVLALDPRPIAPDAIDQESYTAELVVVLTDDRGRRVLHRRTVTLEVTR